MKNEGASFLLAVQFLTRLPIRSDGLYSPERMVASVRYYPLVGFLIGCVCAIVFWGAQMVFPIIIAVLLAVAAGLLLTGAFHEDGLADTFDGIGGGHERAQALEIMRDSRLGTYGTVALGIALAVKVTTLSALTAPLIPAAFIAAHCLSRLSSVLVIATSRYVRQEGTGKPVAQRLSPISLIFILLLGSGVVAFWGLTFAPVAILYAVGGLIIGHLTMRIFFEPKLGGYTGDTLGAVQQMSEIGFYLGLVVWL